MGTASLFDGILKERLSIHAGWLPITNTFKIGDYGLISDGVLFPMGNIREFGVGWQEAAGPPASLDFASEGTHVNRLVGEATVKAFPDQDIDASLTIEFDRDSCSFLVKAKLTVAQMQNVAMVGQSLWDQPAIAWFPPYTSAGNAQFCPPKARNPA